MDLPSLFIPDITIVILGVLAALGMYGIIALLIPSQHDHGAKTVGWNGLDAVGVTIAIYFLGQLGGTVLTWLLFYAVGNTPAQINLLLSDPSAYLQFAFMVLIEGVTIAMVWLFLRRRRTLWRSIGWVRPRLSDTVYAGLGAIAYYGIYIALIQLVSTTLPGIDLEAEQDLGFTTDTTGLALGLVFLSLVVLPPLVEEIVFRGVLYTGLRKSMNVIGAAISTSVLFAAAHLLGGVEDALLWVAAIDTFILSLVLVYLREKTGSLWPAILLHAIKNGVAFLLLFVLKVA